MRYVGDEFRSDLGSRVLLGRGAEVAPPVRVDPFGLLVEDYHDIIAVRLQVALTATESVVSRQIAGPYRIDAFSGRCGVAATTGVRATIVATDNDSVAQTILGGGQQMFDQLLTDSADAHGAFYLTTLLDTWPLGKIVHQQLSRIVVIVQNAGAAAQDVLCTVHITHLRPDGSPGVYSRT